MSPEAAGALVREVDRVEPGGDAGNIKVEIVRDEANIVAQRGEDAGIGQAEAWEFRLCERCRARDVNFRYYAASPPSPTRERDRSRCGRPMASKFVNSC